MQPDNDPEFSRLLKEQMDQYKAPDQLRRRIVLSIPALVERRGRVMIVTLNRLPSPSTAALR